MTRETINTKYFKWLYNLVCDPNSTSSYKKLFRLIHRTNFTYLIELDGNRAEEGIDLRYRFAYDNGIEYPIIAAYLDDRDCSVLEMMIALAIRCEEHIMEDLDIGNRTAKWFWDMMTSLGLEYMDDDNFDLMKAKEIIHIFLNREYKRNGEGGLFTIKNCEHDLRCIEIWYQMCLYLGGIEDETI